VRLAFSALTLAEIFRARHYVNLPGQLMEGLSRLFASNVQVYIYAVPRPPASAIDDAVAPWLGAASAGGEVCLDALALPHPEAHLFRYLVESGFLQDLRGASGGIPSP
jgi:hypothetical protein